MKNCVIREGCGAANPSKSRAGSYIRIHVERTDRDAIVRAC